MTRLALLALALAQTAAAADVSVRVLELFHPERVELAAPPGGRVALETAAGWRTIARPIATRWRCPPESWRGRRLR